MEVIQLSRNHLKQVRELLLGQKTFFGIPVDDLPIKVNTEEAVALYAVQYLADDSVYYKSFGAFDDSGRLLGIVNADFNQFQPYWIVRRLAVREDFKGLSESLAVNHALIGHITQVAEGFGYFQHYSLVPAKYSRAHGRLWAENPVRKGRYAVSEIEVVPAGQQSRFRMFWESLYGRVVYPLPTAVRFSLRTAKDPYRGEQTHVGTD
jgi:hypothetical protein